MQFKKYMKTKTLSNKESAPIANALLSAVNSLDYKNINNIEFDGIDHRDCPDYCDAYIVSAEHNNKQMTEQQIEELNNDRDFVYERLMKYLY